MQIVEVEVLVKKQQFEAEQGDTTTSAVEDTGDGANEGDNGDPVDAVKQHERIEVDTDYAADDDEDYDETM